MKLAPCVLFLFLLLIQLSPNQSVAQEQRVPFPEAVLPLEPEVENPDEAVGLIVLSDESPLQVLDMLERLTDKIILRRQDIAAAKINFNSRGPLTKAEAVLALESLLTLNGIMLTDMGGRFMKAVPATNVNSHVPEMIFDSTLDMDPSQQIYAKLFKFDYLKAETTSGTMITPLLSQNSSIVIFQKSNAILVSDALLNLQRIERLVKEMDQPQKVREVIKFIKLNFVQATEMQQRIENLIQGPLKNYLEGNTSVNADERTNQLILIAHPGNVEIITNIVESVDIDAAPLTKSEVFPLRQAKAEEVVPIIEEIITGQQEGREQDAQVGANDGNPQTTTPQPAQGTPPAPNAPPTPATIAANLSSSLAGSSLQFSNFVGLSADERTNSIVAYGTHQDLKTLEDLIEKIDIPLPQVRIEVIITEVTLTENQASGLSSFSTIFNDRSSNAPNEGTGPVTFDLDSIGSSPGSSLAEFGNFTINAVLDLAENDNKVKILSAPTIVVSHNEEGQINVSQSRPFETGSVVNTNSEAVTNQIEYRDVGIQLTVTPLIGSDMSVTMQIEQTVDNVFPDASTDDQSTGQDGNNTSAVNTNPIIGKREANSTITVKNREVIILGGLQQNQKDVIRVIFPILGQLPIVKKLFNSEITEYNRTELIIFVRPTILQTPDDANQMSEELLDVLYEGDEVREYLETGATGTIYLEDSKFENELIKEQKKEEKLEKKEAKKQEKLEAKEQKKAKTETGKITSGKSEAFSEVTKANETMPRTAQATTTVMPEPEVKATDPITAEFEKAATLALEEALPEIIETANVTEEVTATNEVTTTEELAATEEVTATAVEETAEAVAVVSETEETATEMTATEEKAIKPEETKLVEKTKIKESKKEKRRREKQEKEKRKNLRKMQRKKQKENEVAEEPVLAN